VGEYFVHDNLGEGASGFVYAAKHVRTQRPVALKMLRRELSQNQSILARFLGEARTINAVGHPNIVEVFGTGTHDGRPYVVLELLRGETLEDRLAQRERLDLKQALPIFLECADALAAAHDRHVVHRDLKPENIFLMQREGGGEITKILDFGIAKLIDGEQPGVTSHGAIVGTPQYMSPEQCVGDDALDHRSDIYSLALVLYRMLTGDLPYVMTGHHLMRYVLAHTQQTPRAPRSLVPDLPEVLETVILRALAKQPEHRYADMRAMALALAPLRSAKQTLTMVSSLVDENLVQALAPEAFAGAGHAVARFVLEGIHAGTLELPGLPTAAMRCIEMLQNPKCTVGGLVEVLGRDPLLVSQLIGRANTASISGASPARTLEQALGRLGMRPLGNLLIEVATRRLFESRDQGIRQAFQLMWDHSIAVAQLAQQLARRLKADPELSYLAGLLHDVGKPIVGAILLEAERVAASKRKAWHSRDAWLALVSSCHREVGFALARSWQLPDEVLCTIARSDRYSLAADASPVNIVCFANALVKRAGVYTRPVEETEIAPVIAEGAQMFKMSDDEVAAIVAMARPAHKLDIPLTR
jgi:putative nucleotidyltransferase with HDIG domain